MMKFIILSDKDSDNGSNENYEINSNTTDYDDIP